MRIRAAVNDKIENEHVGIRASRSCIDTIAKLWIIVKHSLDLQSLLYMSSIHFQKAFDVVDRQTVFIMVLYVMLTPRAYLHK